MRSIYTAVNWAVAIAEDDSHGYDQGNRYGPDYDCSSFVAAALIKGGFNIDPESWTGNMYSQLIADGWTTVPVSAARGVGHIFLNTQHHVIMCVDENKIVQASINENGETTGGQTGDQTGREIYVGNYYEYSRGWDYHLVPPADSYNGQVLPDAKWHNKIRGAFTRESQEAFENAIMAFKKLSALGWSVNAISAVWGNIGSEGGYNPWRWESDSVLASTDTGLIASSTVHGYGLVQFTPSGKYINATAAKSFFGYGPNFSDVVGNQNDGDAQLEYIDGYADYYPTAAYPISIGQFKTSDYPPEYLARAWLYNYERPANPGATVASREADARYWYDILSQYDPNAPITKKDTFKIMFYLKPKYKRMGGF